MNQDINVLALVKGAERYVFLYDDSSRAETVRMLGRYASNPELSFTWYDAAVLSQKIRRETRKATSTRRFDLPLTSEADEAIKPSNRLGLLGMRERAAYVGGILNVKSVRRGGTEIEVLIPLPPMTPSVN